MSQDIPLLGEVRQLLKIYRAFGCGLDTLYNYLLQAASPHEFAAGLIAIRIETGSFGGRDSGWQRNDFTDKAYGIAVELFDDIKANLRVSRVEVLQNSYNKPKLVSDLSSMIQLSDEARSEQRAIRLAEGSGYKGSRMIRAKVNHVSGMYFGKLSGQNIQNYKR